MTVGRGSRIALAVVLAVALGLRLGLASQRHFPSYDGTFYLRIAASILESGKLGLHTFPPGWPLLVAVAAGLAGATTPSSLVLTAAFVNAVFGTLTIALTFWLFRALSMRPRVAVITCAVLAVLPLHVELSISDLSEIAYSCCLLGSAILVLRERWLSAGAVLGFGYLVRPEAAIPYGVLLAVLLVRRDGSAVLRLLISWAAFYLPYSIYLSMPRGALQWSSKQGFLVDAMKSRRGVGEFLVAYGRNGLDLLRHMGSTLGPGVLLAAAGLIRGERLVSVYLATLLVYPVFAFRMDARYVVPYLPFLLVSIAVVFERMLRRHGRTRIAAVALVGVMFLYASVGQVRDFRIDREFYPVLEQAGNWLRSREGFGTSSIVAARKPYAAFWASSDYVRLPDDLPLGNVAAWCTENEVSYLVVHVGLLTSTSPQLVPLTHPETGGVVPGLVLEKVLSLATVRGGDRAVVSCGSLVRRRHGGMAGKPLRLSIVTPERTT